MRLTTYSDYALRVLMYLALKSDGLSTIAEMDRIIVLEQGRIVEQGSHAGLLAQGGLYARYWNRQSGGFIGTDEKEAAE